MPGSVASLIRDKGFGLVCLAEEADAPRVLAELDPDWVVLGHYESGAGWCTAAVPDGARVLVIDDLADRRHQCDMLLDQQHGRRAADCDGLVPAGARRLVGPDYAPLRPEFAAASQPAVRDIALRLTAEVEIIGHAEDMARRMAEADLAIGAGGGTSWERCCLGLPTAVLILAENQRLPAGKLAAAGAVEIVGDFTRARDLSGLRAFLRRARSELAMLQEMSRNAAALVDGRGAARVAEAMPAGAAP